jgi:DNA-binding GntR family transcriptional regulator
MPKVPEAGATIVLEEKAAAQFAAGIKEAKLANIREVLSKSKEISAMRAEDVDKLARLAEANVAHGSCGIGCW